MPQPRRSYLAEAVGRPGSRATDARADALKSQGVDVLPLSGHPQVTLPDHVVHAVSQSIAENASAPSRGLPSLREALAWRTQALYGRALDPDQHLVVVNGAMQGLSLSFRALLNPGDEVLMPSPCFFFEGAVRLAGGTPRYVPMDPAVGYAWDLDRIERAIAPQTRVLLVSSPVNPTGYVVPADDCARLAEIALRHGLTIVSDEAYERFVYDGQPYPSMHSQAERLGSRLVVIASASKSYAMSGLRVGWVIGDAVVIESLVRLLEWEQLACNPVGQHAVAAAITGPQAWMDDVVSQFEERRTLMTTAFEEMAEIRTHRPPAGPFFLLDTSRLDPSAQVVSRRWLDEYGIPTTPGDVFQAPGHLRLGHGVPSTLHTGVLIDRVRQAVAGLAGRALVAGDRRRQIDG
ncbi:MAG: pyridoxal phosphate-dependent aminotransferase [Chloroflexi bacterium]|nr:pyridoxal phosphate-dependent aminotransferase [Chloroflexota bacterium]